jgi:hypothetical protein
MAGNWRGGSNSHPQRKSSAPTAPQAKLAPIGWRRHSGREVAKASNRVWLRRVAGFFAIVVLAGLLVALYLLLKPERRGFQPPFRRVDCLPGFDGHVRSEWPLHR